MIEPSRYSVKVTTAPTELPVTLDEAKAFLRETNAEKDPEVQQAIAVAASEFDGPEGLLNRCLVTQTLEFKMDTFPGLTEFSYFGRSYFDLPLPPLQSVTSITYLDGDGDSQTLASSKYRVLNTGTPTKKGRIELEYGESWPTTYDVEQAVTVTFVAGYGARNTVPEFTRALIMARAKELYDHRDPVAAEQMMHTPAYRGLFARAMFPGHA